MRDTGAKQQQVNADQATYDRYASLVKQHAVTQQETDDARYKLAADQQAVRASESQARALLAKLDGKPDIAVEDMPSFKQAQAQVAEAEREMNHSVVRAPYDGIVTQVNKLQPGMYLGASTAAFGLVSTDHVWVEAEPKETAADLCARMAIRCDVSFDTLSRAQLERHGGERGAGDRPEFLPVAGGEFVGQLGEGGAADSGAGAGRYEARRSAAARGHERRYRHRYRSRPHVVGPVLGFVACRANSREVVPHRAMITVCAMLATLMQSLDSTIANVALPYMQGSLSASSDQITWVLTSYITAAAIMTAPVGWLSARFGLKRPLSDLDDRLHRGVDAVRHRRNRCRRWWCSGCCKACSARRWCRCRSRRC